MRFTVFAFAFVVLLGGCAANPNQIQILSYNPSKVEVGAWCWAGSNCQQAASDLAQAYCRTNSADNPRFARYERAELVGRTFSQGDQVVFVFRCVRPRWPWLN
jgi:hypothetical protein